MTNDSHCRHCAWPRPRSCARSAIRRRQATTSNRTSGRRAATAALPKHATPLTLQMWRVEGAPTLKGRAGPATSGSAGCATLETAASAARRWDGASFRWRSGMATGRECRNATSGLARDAASHEIRTTSLGSGKKRPPACRACCRRASGGRAQCRVSLPVRLFQKTVGKGEWEGRCALLWN